MMPMPKSTAATAVATIAAHCREVNVFSLMLTFGAGLVFKEFAELDERVEQGLRNLVLV